MADVIRWGILGPGNIARPFARGLAVLPEARLVAVGSRSQANADRFGEEFHVPRRHASYAALAADPEVDVVYVATPHPFHMEHTLLCLAAGKAVLCEKPLAINAGQVERMIQAARTHRRFLMEAHWSRFLPTLVQVRQWLAAGAVGEVRCLMADFGFRTGWNPEGRLLNPHLAGGGLLDVGCYTVSLAFMVFGQGPERIVSFGHIGATGVDEQAAAILSYPGGRLAQVACAVRTPMPQEAYILGTEGTIHLHAPWWRGTRVTLKAGSREETLDLPFAGTGYNGEAAEVMACLRQGRLESPLMPLDESLAIMKTLDQIRGQWGLKYPME